jgi:hypothetical protein
MSIVSEDWSQKTYFIASEAKDVYCLTPLASLMDRKIHVLDSLSDQEVTEIISVQEPTFVCASRIALSFLESIRPRDSFVAVGIEHGLAPFKAYTYSEKLLDYDVYFAPTQAWGRRLKNLYNDKAERVLVTGYPRLETLKTVRDALQKIEKSNRDQDLWEKSNSNNILVVFSWGVSSEAFEMLPDDPSIVYLVHPADAYLVETVKLKSSKIIVSNPVVTSKLLAYAEIVFGDFSSLTIEAEFLGLPVNIFACRELYKFDCDVGDDFFDRSNPKFFATPYYDTQVVADEVISSVPELINAIKSAIARNIIPIKKRLFPEEFYPPAESSLILCLAALSLTAKRIENGEYKVKEINIFEANLSAKVLNFLTSAYRDLLGRPPDVEGIRTYMIDFRSNTDPGPIWSIKILQEISSSQEGKNYWNSKEKNFAFIQGFI